MARILSRTECGVLLAIVALSLICAGIPSFFLGLFIGYLNNDVERGNRDVDEVKELIAAQPDSFGALRIDRGPADKFMIKGSVKTQKELNLLQDKLQRMFGERRTKHVLAVTVSGDGSR